MDRPAALVTLALVWSSAPLDAQAVRGLLADRGTGHPIQGAFVTLLDETGLEVARTLTGIGGTFLLQAPAAGVYRLRSKRIGFRPSESPPLALADSQTAEYRLEVEAVPVELPAVVVRGQPQCGAKPGAAAAVAQLWEEAREALSAVKWAQDQSTLVYTVERFERTLPRQGRQVLAQRDSAWAGFAQRPFQSVPAEQLARDGFVVAAPGDSVDYQGPDAEVLLGDPFLATHCFNVLDGGAQYPGLVGLSFEPEPRRRVPDIAGVLWLERQTLELRFIEFHYTRLRDRSAGGRVDFLRLSFGPWIVRHWWLRIPRVEPRRSRGLRRPPPRVIGYREGGGIVTMIQSAGGAVEYRAAPAVLDGRVIDASRGGSPLSEAIVSIAGTDHQAVSDELGRFGIAGPFAGDYGVSFRHPRLDSLGITADEQRVILAHGVRQTVTLVVPPESVVVRRLCHDDPRPDRRVIVGVVRDSTLAPVPHARIDVQVPGREPQRAGRANEAGRFVLCEVPAMQLTVVATDTEARRGQVVLAFQEGGVLVDGRQFHRLPGRIWIHDIQLRR